MERPIKKNIGTNFLDLDTPSLILDLDAFKDNLDIINFKLNSANLSVRIDVNSHLTKDILNLQLNGFSNALGISSSNVNQASIFSHLADDIIVDAALLSTEKINSLISINAQNSYNSLLQLQNINHENLCGIYLKINADNLSEFDNTIFEYTSENNLKISGIIFEYSSFNSLKNDTVTNFLSLFPDVLKITNNFIASGKIKINDYANLDSKFTEIIINKLPLTDVEILEYNPELNESVKILSSVLSIPDDDRMILDTGNKAMNIDYGFPVVKNINSAVVKGLSAEHASILINQDELKQYNIQDKIELIPSDISSVVNQFDFISVIKNKKLMSVFNISARGVYK